MDGDVRKMAAYARFWEKRSGWEGTRGAVRCELELVSRYF